LASVEDLRREFEKMKPCFEGKETEHNWIERDRSVAVVRGMVEGGVTKQETPIGDLREEFVKCIKEIQEGIIKTVSSSCSPPISLF
jgi:CLIP-associating protein 1/2